MPTYAEFMAAIRAIPNEDAPRLIYADWLEEQGEQNRAEFIRVQCRIAKYQDKEHCPECRFHWAVGVSSLNQSGEEYTCQNDHKWQSGELKTLYQQQRELFNPKWWEGPGKAGLDEDWNRFSYSIGDPNDPSKWILWAPIQRGFFTEVHCSLEIWLGGSECPYCINPVPSGIPPIKCPWCNKTGRIRGVGFMLVKQYPITKVVITDFPIYPSNGNNTYHVEGLERFPLQYWSQLHHLPSRRAALNACSQMCLQLVKSNTNI